jgi:1-acyl-sn-glycerol-3-phosphate acyltransferase
MVAELQTGSRLPARERRGDAYFWRFLVTALSFSLFSAGALVVGFLLMPLMRILPAARERKRSRARSVMSASLRLFVALMSGLGGMTYEFRGAERLGRSGQLIIANHPSLIDVVFLLAFVPGTGCVVKQSLWRNRLTRGAVMLAEFITNDPTAVMIEAATGALRDGQAVIMFPEGTRTVPERPFVFHRGAANVALRAAVTVTPVYIRCRPTTLTKADPWYRIPSRRPHFSLVVGADIDLAPYRAMASLPVSSRAFNEHLQAHFQAGLARLDEIDGRAN